MQTVISKELSELDGEQGKTTYLSYFIKVRMPVHIDKSVPLSGYIKQ